MASKKSSTVAPRVSRTIVLFGITSLLADIAGEMLFPILPMYFTTVLGMGVAALGVIEGIADGSGDLMQVWFGWLSDKIKRRKIFVITGYATAAFGKILLALSTSGFLAFFARFFDRCGKGIRTTPRDAMIAEAIDKDQRGWAFGFHRTMDNAGAVIGNSLVIALLALQFPLRDIVWLSLIPAFLAIFFLLPVREVSGTGKDNTLLHPKKVERPTWADFTRDRKKFGKEFWQFIFVSFIFYLGKISYAFMLLRAGDLGVVPEAIPYLYILFNIMQAAFSLPVGKLADGFGKAILVFISFVVFSLMSFGFVFGGNVYTIVSLFVLFGLSFAFIEVGVRSFAVELSPHHLKATGLGIFFTITGLTTVIASWTGGLLWQLSGGAATFWYSGIMSGVASVLFLALFWRRILGAFTRLLGRESA